MIMKVLIVEDEKIKRITLTDALLKQGYAVLAMENPIEALNIFKEREFDVVITDIRLPHMDGLDFLKEIKTLKPETTAIVMTAYATIDTAIKAMKLGAYDYITKPFSSEELLLILERLKDFRRLVEENIKLKQEITERYSFGNIIGKSKKMRDVYELIKTVAPSDATTLIIGESGTGKELIANAIHYNSPRKDNPLIKFSCSALAETLLESELFGHEKGAFTGAVKERKGRFELANNGSIFLDDIDDIPLSMQTKLLRVLQEKEIERVGGTKTIKIDIRIICATKVDLLKLAKQGKFREDLYYRLNIVPIKLPPLRDRKEDIPLLVEYLLNKYSSKGEKKTFCPEAMKLLINYDWPGNVRELENVVERVVTLTRSNDIRVEDLPDFLMTSPEKLCDRHLIDVMTEAVSFEAAIKDMEKRLLILAIEKAGGNKSEAARILKMKRETLRDKVEKYGILELSQTMKVKS
ncbi:MAG: sigma-54-dependent Fis family transcriptional regulator [Deltaproteobacteria bacterium]|nr:sigma-54-dependent Fis family transcriptional regulator [Deltaproteobacteria bacterium]